MKSHHSNKLDVILATLIQHGKNEKTVTSQIWSFPLLPPIICRSFLPFWKYPGTSSCLPLHILLTAFCIGKSTYSECAYGVGWWWYMKNIHFCIFQYILVFFLLYLITVNLKLWSGTFAEERHCCLMQMWYQKKETAAVSQTSDLNRDIHTHTQISDWRMSSCVGRCDL